MDDKIDRSDATVRWVRSALFVPANRPDFLSKAITTAADALILDLEDSIPEAEKARALDECDAWLAENKAACSQKVMCLRVNAHGGTPPESELAVAVRGGIEVVMLPKVTGPDAVVAVDRTLTYLEGRHGRPCGSTRIWPLAETAQGVRLGYEIATASTRVAYMGGGVSPLGDMARELGCETTTEGTESLYVRSKLLLDVRAAGVLNPVTGVVTEIGDLEVLRVFARQGRQLGYEGMMVIHPSHIEVVNETFGSSADQIEAAQRLLDALDAAERDGRASVTVDGRMVDIAMRRSAEELLERAGHPRVAR